MSVEEWANKERSALKSSELICDASWMRVQKNILSIEGEKFERFQVIHCGAIAVLPITAKGRLILEKQYRYPFDEIMLEVPAGRLDPGEEPKEAAHRELREEIGLDAKELVPMGLYLPSPGYCTEKVHLFVAKDLYESPLESDVGEVIEQIEMSLEEALDLVEKGRIPDGKTALMILKYAMTCGGLSH